jgi:hypothetical protein
VSFVVIFVDEFVVFCWSFLRKIDVSVWCFGGVRVVFCVAGVVFLQSLFGMGKM